MVVFVPSTLSTKILSLVWKPDTEMYSSTNAHRPSWLHSIPWCHWYMNKFH